MHSSLCIIPARGGSKRIPKKNIKNFLGKPIIAYSIEAAIKSGLFAEVMVSTDDEKIAELAIQYGAKVPFFRTANASNDFATTLDVLREVSKQYEERGNIFSNICCLYATAPFVSDKKLQEAFAMLTNYDYKSVLPVLKYSFPIQRSFIMGAASKINYQYPEYKNARSQDLTPVFHDAGQFYWMKKEVLELSSIITDNTGSIIINELEGQDIDDETDWKLAELKYELLQSLK